MLAILFLFGTLFAMGAYLISADMLKVPTLASTKAVLAMASHSKKSLNMDAIVIELSEKLSKFVRIDDYNRRKMLAVLKSADIKLKPETYIAKAWVKAGLISCLIIPLLFIFPLLVPVVIFLAIAVYFKERRQADEIIKQKRDKIEYELPRFVSTIAQDLKSSRDVLTMLKNYQKNAGKVMKRELEITIADMVSGNEETALTRFESRIGSTMLSDVIRGLISVKRGDNGILYFEMLSMTFKQLELQRLKLAAAKQPGRMRKYSFFMLGCFLLMYLGVLGYEVANAFSKLF